MRTITIISDWQNNPIYITSFKQHIKKLIDEPVILDEISHNIENFNIAQAGITLQNLWPLYDEGTIHIIAVTNEFATGRKLIVKYNNQYFISSDSGVFGYIFNNKFTAEIYLISKSPLNKISSFPSINTFVICAKLLIENNLDGIKNYSSKIKKYEEAKNLIKVETTKNSIKGVISYIDNYGNAITNISSNEFNTLIKNSNREFSINIKNTDFKITELSHTYFNIPVGEKLALFNSFNLLELAINKENLAQKYNLEVGNEVEIQYR